MATASSGVVPAEVVWAHAAGAPSNGVDDDTPVVQALLDANKLTPVGMYFKIATSGTTGWKKLALEP